jgi:hypothetical protein
MFALMQNVFPDGKWKNVKVDFRGKGDGSCIHVELSTENKNQDLRQWVTFSLHYGDDPVGFVKMLKEAFENLDVPEEKGAHLELVEPK